MCVQNIFIECTATDLTKAKITLDTLVTMFSEYCKDQFEVEPVEVEQCDGSVTQYPVLMTRTETVDVQYVNQQIGIQ